VTNSSFQCDQQQPECRRCRIRGLSCPGPLTGLRIVKYEAEDTPNPAAANIQLAPPLLQQHISLGPSFDQLFFSHFYDVFGDQNATMDACSWIKHFPDLVTCEAIKVKDNSLILQPAIRAPCMALYGLLTDDQNFQIAAYQWYARSLQHQRLRLKHTSSQLKQPSPSPSTYQTAIEATLVPPVMMCYFELITGGRRWQPDGTLSTEDTSQGWAIHIEAGARMVQLIGGPEVWYSKQHCSDIARQLYRTIQLGILHTSLGRQKGHFFSQGKWMRQPPDGSEKTPLDYLMDILLRLPGCLEMWNMMSSLPSSDELHARLEAEIWELLGQADEWRQRHRDLVHSLDESAEPHEIIHTPGDDTDLSKHSLTAMLLAGYVTLYSLLWLLGPTSIYREQAFDYGKVIIRLAKDAVLVSASPNWASPLKIVSTLSPDLDQRNAAFGILTDVERRTRLEMLKTIF
jgi:hypothetical protein